MAETVEPAGSQPLGDVDIQGLIDKARADGAVAGGPGWVVVADYEKRSRIGVDCGIG